MAILATKIISSCKTRQVKRYLSFTVALKIKREKGAGMISLISNTIQNLRDITRNVIVNPFQRPAENAGQDVVTATPPDTIPIVSEDEVKPELANDGTSSLNPILISDDEIEADQGRVKGRASSQRSTVDHEENRPLGFLPVEYSGRDARKFEEELARRKTYGPEWLVRPQNLRRRGREPETGYKACWLDDYSPELDPPAERREKDLDRLPRWFGPLTYSVVYYNHDRPPRNSVEFFKLAFQPTEPGDLEVWNKYREVEEVMWVNKWDFHEGFKLLVGDLHSIAFGQKEEAKTRCEQMDKVISQFAKDLEQTPWEERDYFDFATADSGIGNPRSHRRKVEGGEKKFVGRNVLKAGEEVELYPKPDGMTITARGDMSTDKGIEAGIQLAKTPEHPFVKVQRSPSVEIIGVRSR